MYTLRYDGDITKSPDFFLRGKATIEVVTHKGYVIAADPETWMKEEDFLQSMPGDDNYEKMQTIWNSDEILKKDRIETIIELHPGSNFQYGYRSPCDEGYSFYGITVHWEDTFWSVEVSNGGRDCDGEHRSHHDYSVNPDGTEFDEKTEVYDQHAEAAGY